LKYILWDISFSSVEKGQKEQVNLLTISVFVIGWKCCSCRLLVVGGGAGGCSIAAKYASKLGKNKVIIIDPADVSYIN
jgi:sulfide:quinone oxidoreductase